MFVGKSEPRVPERYIDPAMIGILAGMALMFIIICVVLRLFSRWVETNNDYILFYATYIFVISN